MVLETYVKFCVTDQDFLEKYFLLPKIRKMDQKRSKTGFFEFIEKFGHEFLVKLFYKENSNYLLYSFTNPIFGKIFVPEIQTKMFSANQIAGFFSSTISPDQISAITDLLHVDTN